jgi:hypothetical protein
MVLPMKPLVCAFLAGLAAATTAQAASRSPLDLETTILTLNASRLPSGLKRGGDECSGKFAGCTFEAPGISYYVDDGDWIAIITMTKVQGRFVQPLPYGLTESSTNSDVRKAYDRLAIAFNSESPGGSEISTGFVRVHDTGECYVDYKFDKAGHVDTAELRCALSSD